MSGSEIFWKNISNNSHHLLLLACSYCEITYYVLYIKYIIFRPLFNMCQTWSLWMFPLKIMEGISVLVFLKMGTSIDPSLNFASIEIILLISERAEESLLAGSATVKINALTFSEISREWKCLQNHSTSCREVFRRLTGSARIIGFAFLLWRTGFWAEKVIYAPDFPLL